MKRMKMVLANLYTGFLMRQAGVKRETESGDHLLEVLGTIIIAVVILILFKDKIGELFSNMIGSTTDKVSGLFENISGTPTE